MKHKLKLSKIYFTLLLILLLNAKTFSKNDYGIYSTYIDSIIYRLNYDEAIVGSISSFKFPPIERGGSYCLKNIKAEKYKEENQPDLYGCVIKFEEPIKINKDIRLKLICYAKNIDSLNIELVSGFKGTPIKLGKVRLKKDLLYYCFDLKFSSLLEEKTIQTDKKDSQINGIRIICNYSKKKQLIINDIVAYIPVKVTATSESSIINEVINKFPIIYQNQILFGQDGKLTPKLLNFFKKTNVDFLKYRIIKEVPPNASNLVKSEKEELEAISNSIYHMLVEYFENTENKKEYLLDEYEKIVSKSQTLDQFYESLDLLLYKLEDNHFKLINEITEPSVSTTLPLYFYKLRNSIQVVSILDTTLLNKINLGDKLISINGKPIKKIIETLDKRTAGSTKHAREMKIMQKLLFYVYSIENKDLTIEFDGIEKGIYSMVLTKEQINNNSCLKIPQNILEKQKRFDYKKIGNISYLKVGIFDEKILRPFFYSYIDSIMQSDGLIIDLRNNPGGDLSGLFLFSFFINNPSVFFTFHNIGGYHETVMINPDPYYNFMKKVVLLIDARTTCSAEFFMDAMTNSRNNIISIGATKTAGSGQNVKYFDLPDTKNFKGGLQYRNSINYSASGKIIDEIGGFKPTVLTSIESYLDLAPYDDQLLEMAKDYLNKYNEQPEESKNMLPFVLILFAVAFCFSWLIMLIKWKKLIRVNNLTLKR